MGLGIIWQCLFFNNKANLLKKMPVGHQCMTVESCQTHLPAMTAYTVKL